MSRPGDMVLETVCRDCGVLLSPANRYSQSAFCRPCCGGETAEKYAAEQLRESAHATAPTASTIATPSAGGDQAGDEAEFKAYLARMAAYS